MKLQQVAGRSGRESLPPSQTRPKLNSYTPRAAREGPKPAVALKNMRLSSGNCIDSRSFHFPNIRPSQDYSAPGADYYAERLPSPPAPVVHHSFGWAWHPYLRPATIVARISEFVNLSGGIMSVEQKVKQIIVEQLGVDEAQVDSTASFVDDLGADSLDIVELVMAFEEAFELDIPDEDAEKIATVKDAVDYIEAKQAKK